MVEQVKLGGIYTLLSVAVLFSLLAMVGSFSNHGTDMSNQLQSLSQQVSSLNIPSASEIASQVKVPEVKLPEFKSNEKVNEVWLKVYEDNISTLKSNAESDGLAEIKKDNYKVLKDFLSVNIGHFDELTTPVEVVNDSVRVKELGVVDKSDKVAKVSYRLKIEYTLKTGTVGVSYMDFVDADELVTYNEGDFSNSSIDLTYSM